jgi:hypothetical protein
MSCAAADLGTNPHSTKATHGAAEAARAHAAGRTQRSAITAATVRHQYASATSAQGSAVAFATTRPIEDSTTVRALAAAALCAQEVDAVSARAAVHTREDATHP